MDAIEWSIFDGWLQIDNLLIVLICLNLVGIDTTQSIKINQGTCILVRPKK